MSMSCERREAVSSTVSCKSTQALTCDRSLLGLGVTGTCLYAIQSGEHVSKLRNDITSPGGTTGRVSIFKEYFDVCHGF
jgi:pyrroline-5-carboxylate reductase